MGIPSKPVGQVIELRLTDAAIGDRLDKALAAAARDVPGLSRSRLAHLIAAGHVTDAAGRTLSDAKVKVKSAETYRLDLPPPAPAEPLPEAIPLSILHEDPDLIVLDKPAGMVVHPAPGAETGTLVNALLAHCGPGLTGIGGVGRPGIVHRIDKDTSGLLVVAKTQAAHAGLSALFAAHDIERVYQAILWGAPDRGDPRFGGLEAVRFEPGTIVIDAPLDRHPTDRKRMAVTAPGKGRRALTRLTLETRFGPATRPFASLA
ncbi:MAG: RluA family pseudouridine synthase, partial [Pseudomonadota bacterium]